MQFFFFLGLSMISTEMAMAYKKKMSDIAFMPIILYKYINQTPKCSHFSDGEEMKKNVDAERTAE